MNEHIKCVECGSSKLVIKKYETYCSSCGFVLENDDILVHQDALGKSSHPFLSRAGTDNVNGKLVKNSWLYTSREKSLKHSQNQIQTIGEKFNLSKLTIAEAQMIFKRVFELGMTDSKRVVDYLYACIYASCNLHNIPRTPFELTLCSEINQFDLMKTYKEIKGKLSLNANRVDYNEYIFRYGATLGLKQETILKAIEILESIRNTKFTLGKNPKSIIASVIYLAGKATNEMIPQRNLANEIGVIEVTIRKRYKEIECYLGSVSPQ